MVQLRTSRHTPHGYVTTTYGEHEIDLIGVYCGDLERCFLLPLAPFLGLTQLHMRLAPARSGQRACITLAEDFDFEGAVAQLGRAPAWHAGGQGFKSPQLHSPPDLTVVGSNPFRDALGYWMDRAAAGEEIVVTRRGKPHVRLSPATALLGGSSAPPASESYVDVRERDPDVALHASHSPEMISSTPSG